MRAERDWVNQEALLGSQRLAKGTVQELGEPTVAKVGYWNNLSAQPSRGWVSPWRGMPEFMTFPPKETFKPCENVLACPTTFCLAFFGVQKP